MVIQLSLGLLGTTDLQPDTMIMFAFNALVRTQELGEGVI